MLNSAGNDGGAYYGVPNIDNGVVVKNCTFVKNTTVDVGGAMYSVGITKDCIFIGNTAERGGAVYCASGGSLIDCIFKDNSATVSGGGLYAYSGTVSGCTYEDNTAPQASAIYGDAQSEISNCDIIGSGNTVYGTATWRSIWTNDFNANCFVTFSTSMP